MKGNDQISIPPEIEFLSMCIVAVSRSEYANALQIMKAGLVELGQHGAPISNRQLAGALYMVFAALESNLKGTFGDGLEQKFKAFEPPEGRVEERCSFCGKERNEVEQIIAGPEVFICSECVGICNKVLASA